MSKLPNYKYNVLPDGMAEITSYTGGAAVLTVPSMLDGYRVTRIGQAAFYGSENLTIVTIPNSVTSIGERAFSGCRKMKYVTLPDSVTNIGDQLFDGCWSLEYIWIPDGVTSIGYRAFANCTHLEAIELPKNLKTIGEQAFEACRNLEAIELPKNLKTIGYRAFRDCESLTNVTIPDSVTSIGEEAFCGCISLYEVRFPAGISCIPAGAFISSPPSLVVLPETVRQVESVAYAECSNLTTVVCEAADEVYFGNGCFEGSTRLREIIVRDTALVRCGNGVCESINPPPTLRFVTEAEMSKIIELIGGSSHDF